MGGFPLGTPSAYLHATGTSSLTNFNGCCMQVLQEVFPDREVVAAQTREIVLGGGNIHCITQQQPQLQPQHIENGSC